jgi:carbon-monoxide dehydrogenase large subunit
MSSEAATIRVDPSGKVSVAVGCASHGQSLETTIPQVVADTLGVDIDDVVLLQGDTATVPFGGGTGGSRSAVLYGGAAIEASGKIRDKVLRIAAHALEAAPEDLVLAHGAVSVAGVPSVSMSLADIARLAYMDLPSLPPGLEPGLEASARFAPPPFTFSNAAHVCTCEVDGATGRTQVLRYIVSEDCGVMINPMVVHGQIAGGVVQGIGGVLYEHVVYDDQGNPLTATLLDYLLPSATEVPTIEYGHVETRASGNPGGFKGMGEGGAIGSPPALINAVADAVWPAGAKVTDQPLGPHEVFELLHPA